VYIPALYLPAQPGDATQSLNPNCECRWASSDPHPGTRLLSDTCLVGIADPTGPSMSTNQSQLATAALETLHGARGLPAAEATAKLRDFVDSIGTILPPTARLADASGALRALVNQLETEGAAADDTWEYAIETMLSFANESA
jgi:hypothetical protein